MTTVWRLLSKAPHSYDRRREERRALITETRGRPSRAPVRGKNNQGSSPPNGEIGAGWQGAMWADLVSFLMKQPWRSPERARALMPLALVTASPERQGKIASNRGRKRGARAGPEFLQKLCLARNSARPAVQICGS